MNNVTLENFIDAGVHFGHQTRRWNPRMKPYIWGQRNGIHIIDLQITARNLLEAQRFLAGMVQQGKTVLFVGTKRSAREIVAEEAERAGMYYVNNRWLGGMLTNFQTVKESIKRLNELEKQRDEGVFERLTKKEALLRNREIASKLKSLAGIKAMNKLPGALFIIDPKKEHIAVQEANRLGIPVVGLCDTNCDPTGIQRVIPGNDDAIKSIRLFSSAIADACIEGHQMGRHDSSQSVAPVYSGEAPEVVHRRRSTQGVEPEASAVPEGRDEASEA